MRPVISSSPEKKIYVDTPIGRLRFYVSLIGGSVENFYLTKRPINPALPQDMSVSACTAVFVEFSVTDTVSECQFCCEWENLQAAGGTESGQGLDAWGSRHNGYLVLVGTEDEDYLARRISLKPALEAMNYPVTLQDKTIRIRLQELETGKQYSLHYIIAWNPYPEEHELSCWYAVDVLHDRIIEQLADTSFKATVLKPAS